MDLLICAIQSGNALKASVFAVIIFQCAAIFQVVRTPIVRISALRISVRLHMRTDLSFESDRNFQNLSLLTKSVIRDKTSITCMLRASGVLLLAADFANNDPFAKHAIPHALQA